MISVTAAIQQIAACRTSWGTERIPLEQAIGRVLAAPVTADRDYPPFNRSLRDGFAIRISDYNTAKKKLFPISAIEEALPGHVIRIRNGDILPAEMDTVIGGEDVEEKKGNVSVSNDRVKVHQHVIRKGEDAAEGDRLLEPGCRIQFQHMGLLAALGIHHITVHRPPKVVIISAGSELRDANSYIFAGLLAQYGIQAVSRIVVQEPALEQAVIESLDADLLLISAGLTTTDTPVLPKLLQDCGIEQVFHRVRAKPCKPFWFGYSPTKTRVMLFPANAFSVEAGAKLFLESYIRACWNLPMVKPWLLPFLDYRAAVHTLDDIVPAILTNKNGLRVRAAHASGAGDIMAASRTDGIFLHSTDTGHLEPGSLVPFYPWADHQLTT
ncbi:molybdopterin molybdotransferase MoeA [Chitinophaga niabensis]|uniref:Molybdopterin molybdenumtransferase n=1 Tax=Chitinophaga niabensis TaxID=536979 RepID=A0A1N6EK97_9BACT|nr:molybdopterin molybdotransferase MoeA [Chitinophaga niabensis]SIN83466.1 molybdopterin molybdochelatase [Chitinophaga niabensis]